MTILVTAADAPDCPYRVSRHVSICHCRHPAVVGTGQPRGVPWSRCVSCQERESLVHLEAVSSPSAVHVVTKKEPCTPCEAAKKAAREAAEMRRMFGM